MNFTARYRDAYWTARTINGTGQTIKALGIALGLFLALAGAGAAYRFGPTSLLAALIFGAAVGLPIYALGVLVAAQGQVLKASLDTAVNTSRLLSLDEMRQILSMDASHASSSGVAGNTVACSVCGRQIPAQSAAIHADRWYCSEHVSSSVT